eukprot:CAMPEP_0113941306 /NCGR_PEP_ID=MMETSP1339-20121228/7253_1 /TAXON_ID=94617 /ORGANISM="Fibrocapsa japonica" /LENGTH=53 /DNA_ID=CAMNT_0000945415 /DNA_START=715 /DNA_END=877 /DNA_ORIENTATION=- /assembly_acc=CAM_ASM_000762
MAPEVDELFPSVTGAPSSFTEASNHWPEVYPGAGTAGTGAAAGAGAGAELKAS